MQVLEGIIFSIYVSNHGNFFLFALMQTMLRHWNKDRGREKRRMQEKNVVSLATGTVLLSAQVASVLKTVKQNVRMKI